MGNAIGGMLPSAVGVAISPLPIVAVVLMLMSPRAHINGAAFVLGWWIGIGLAGTLVLVLVGAAGGGDDGGPATWVDIVKVVLGILFLFLAVRNWRQRPKKGAEAHTPRWMRALGQFNALKAAGLAFLLSALNPKNLALIAAGSADIAQAGIPSGQEAMSLAVFALIVSAALVVPVVIYFVMGDRVRKPLDELKEWLAHHNNVIMAVLLLVFGAKFIGESVAGLF